MSRQRLAASTALLLLATAALLGYLYRHELAHLLALAAVARVSWLVIRFKLGIKPRVRRGEPWWKLGGAALAGWLVGRQKLDAVAQAVRSGAELQVHVHPKRRYPRG